MAGPHEEASREELSGDRGATEVGKCGAADGG